MITATHGTAWATPATPGTAPATAATPGTFWADATEAPDSPALPESTIPLGTSFFAGCAWFEPGGSPFGDIYKGRLGLSAGVGHEWSNGVRAEIRVARYVCSAPLWNGAAALAEDVEGEIRVIPLVLEALYRMKRVAPRFSIGIGGGLWFHEERILYTLAGQRNQVESGRTSPAFTASLTWDHPAGGHEIRLYGRYDRAFLDEKVIRGSAEIDGTGLSAHWIALGMEFAW